MKNNNRYSQSNQSSKSSKKKNLNNNNNKIPELNQYTFNHTSSSKSKDIYAEDSSYEIESLSKQNFSDNNNNNTIINNNKNKNNNNNKNIINNSIKIINNDDDNNNNNNNENNNNENNENDINYLKQYKNLCEKRIKQLNPSETFPITKNSLSNNNLIKSNINPLFESRYENLYEKYMKLLNDYNDKLNNTNNNNNSSSNNLSYNSNNQSNFSTENYTFEKYKTLKKKYKNLKKENQKIVELLREETLATEEQKNIIFLLQNTIDNELIKNGNINKYITSENLVDFTRLKNENENYRKELVLSQALVNSLKSELEMKGKNDDENLSLKKKFSDKNFIL